mmetsp:Transcript_42321/g.48075  ORF Transcript_42321/g.48075 Transcript_42321/m.48075 type:complete len:207 (+) Transcript_42321:40-660(+)
MLWEAARDGDETAIRSVLKLSEGENLLSELNFKDQDGWTPLHHASAGGDETTTSRVVANYEGAVTSLLEMGADPNARNNYQETSLHVVQNVEVARILIDAGADILARDKDGDTPLHSACYDGNKELVKFFLSVAESDPNIQNNIGDTPLHKAIEDSQCEESVKVLLLGSNADTTILNDDCESPVDFARENNNRQIIQSLYKRRWRS